MNEVLAPVITPVNENLEPMLKNQPTTVVG